ncbi:hypothetical protein FF1_040725 [Malus domestica]
MAQEEVEDLVVHLEDSMEHGIHLIGAVLVDKTLNKQGIRNVLRSSLRELGDIQIKWVRDNTFIMTVRAVPSWAIAWWTGDGTGPESPSDLVQHVLAMKLEQTRGRG